ncbi:uncharacterized protein LOC143850350 [Tasmannia lanceolata]|uniref:uncharacterized protein LOC143850350 n=1 Tax=Tasmannia lanceolata TaxID=3420 RepID=UPI004064AAB6
MPVYYLSKKMLDYELNYTHLEKTCLALVWATQRLRHYLLSQRIYLVSCMDLMKYLFKKPALIGRTARSLLLLSEFDITYVTQKFVEGRIIAEQLADAPTEDAELSPCIAGLEAALSLEVQDHDVYGNSLLIICQTNGKWLTKEDRLIPYHTYLTSLMKSFHNISFTYISRLRNKFADALATLASMVDIPVGVKVHPLVIKRHVVPAHVHMIQIAARCPDEKHWYFDIKNLISSRGHPPEASLKERRALQTLASRYVICGEDLYRRSFDGVQLLCVDEDRAAEILEDVHSCVCGLHMNGKMLARKILRLGYFWTTLEEDCFFVCQNMSLMSDPC